MDRELARCVEALRRPLLLAAADRFAGLRKVKGLGHALRAACDGLIHKVAAEPTQRQLAAWRVTLATWEQLAEDQQEIEIARGMRLIALLPRAPQPPSNHRAGPGNWTLPAQKPGPAAAPSTTSASDGPGSAQRSTEPATPSRAHMGASDKPPTDKPPTDKPPPDKPPTDKPPSDKLSSDSPSSEKSPTTKPSSIKAGSDKPSFDRSPSDKSPSNRSASNRSASNQSPSNQPSNQSPSNQSPSNQSPSNQSPSNQSASARSPSNQSASARSPSNKSASARSPSTRSPSNPPTPIQGNGAPAGETTQSSRRAPAPEADPLGAPTHSLPGIGPAFAEKLAGKGLETVEDLLWCLPRRYDDVRDAKSLAEVARMSEGERATFSAKVASSRMVFARGRRWAEVRIGGIDLTGAQLASDALGGGPPVAAVVRWFNVWAGIEKRMPAGSVVTLSGVVKKRSGRLEFANPDILAIDVPEAETAAATQGATAASGAAPDGAAARDAMAGTGAPATGAVANGAKAKKPLPTIIARYPEVAGVPASRLRTACQTACERVGAFADDGVPKTIEVAAQMPSLRETLSMLHAPPAEISVDDLAALNRGDSAWQRRLAFGELFALGVAVALRRRERRADAAVPCVRTPDLEDELGCALPFTLTGAQRRAIRELGDDLVRAVPMNRLLQGDVGAGKTAVAFAAALHVARARRQVAVMAPTELLAEQHAETWKKWATLIDRHAKRPLRVELLTASTPKGVRQSLLALLGAGAIDILIGTHSLIAEGVGFHSLGLVVIDEQHRFGVAQRAKLRDKGDGQGAPHLLVMTATPIPRTLALTAYGDLDVSILDELPPGREPVQTKILAGKRGEAAAYKLIAERAAAGERAYVVCPKVEDDGESEVTWKDATTVATEISAALPQLRVGLVHGRLDGDARDRVMRAFKQGELDVLVATTVIEVGVDVPAATVMVIHDAERFGLAQLHQLRGRVGRGTGNAHCVLVTHGGISEDGRRRLDAMVRTTDGFVIAEEDLALRGPGELLGPRQAGVPRLRFGSLAQHTELLLEARRHAERILDEDPDLVRPEHVALRRALTRRLAQSVYGAESG